MYVLYHARSHCVSYSNAAGVCVYSVACMRVLQEAVLDVDSGDVEGETIRTGPSSTETEYDPDDVLSLDLQRVMDRLRTTPQSDKECLDVRSPNDGGDSVTATCGGSTPVPVIEGSPSPSRHSRRGELYTAQYTQYAESHKYV